MAAVPSVRNQGTRGTRAPPGEQHERAEGGRHGRAEIVGVDPEHGAGREVEEPALVEGQLGGGPLRRVPGEPGVGQPGRELPQDQAGVALHQGPDLAQDALVQLHLAPDAHPLPGRHRERPGDEAGEASGADGRGAGGRPGPGQDQAHVGHEAVVDAEHGGPGTALGHGLHPAPQLGCVPGVVGHPGFDPGRQGPRAAADGRPADAGLRRRGGAGTLDRGQEASRSRSARTASTWPATSVTSVTSVTS